MPVLPIDDLDDPRIAMYRQVKDTNQTRDLGQFVLEGEKLLRRLLESRFETASVLVTDRALDRILPLVPADVPLFIVPHAAISALVGYNFHLGVLACGRRRPWPDLPELLRAAGPAWTLVLCPHVDNPENLGAIVRIADVFGLTAVLAGQKSPDPLSRRVLRVSMGTSLFVPVLSHADLDAVADWLQREAGAELAAAAVHEPGSVPLDTFRRPPRLALVLGNESHGLDASWFARCDHRVTIPMRPGAESLNVSVAAGILLYHLTGGGSFPAPSDP